MRRVFAMVAAAVLAACATSTPYQPAQKDGFGFSEQRIESNRYTITFAGNALTERDAVESSLLYRAAELTVKSGFDYFVTASRAVDPKREVYAAPHYGFTPYYSYYAPRWGWRPIYDPFWNSQTISEVTRYTATAEIAMFKGQKPAGDVKAFDARDVMANLGPRVTAPPAR